MKTTTKLCQNFIRPMLVEHSDGNIHTRKEINRALENYARKQGKFEEWNKIGAGFNNHCDWTRKFIIEAGLLDRVGHGQYKITDRGLNVLHSGPELVTYDYLKDLSPHFRAWMSGKVKGRASLIVANPPHSNAPVEQSVEKKASLSRATIVIPSNIMPSIIATVLARGGSVEGITNVDHQ